MPLSDEAIERGARALRPMVERYLREKEAAKNVDGAQRVSTVDCPAPSVVGERGDLSGEAA